MKISVFGLGYVGSVTAACFAKMGHQVIGVDVDRHKAAQVNESKSPVREPGLDELVSEMVSVGRLMASTESYTAVLESDVSMVCVGTPSRPSGGLDLRYVYRVMREIGQHLNSTNKEHWVVLRSTALPGTSARCLRELQQSAGRHVKVNMVYNPEFLREGSALRDFFSPPYTVIGTRDEYASRLVVELYRDIPGETVVTSWETAELLKYANNAFHALKITFANEIGRVAKEMGVDPFEVIHLVAKDTKLNLSPAYLMPGFAFGGSCLPKDLRALIEEARFLGVELPMIESLPRSNKAHLASAMNLIREAANRANSKEIGLVGLAFKESTDDLRESPSVELAERLLAYGYRVTIFDPYVDPDILRGSSKIFVDQQIPDLPDIITDDLEQLVSQSPVLIVAHIQEATANFIAQRVSKEQFIIDLTGALRKYPLAARYQGLCW